jgi:hypothetical protein
MTSADDNSGFKIETEYFPDKPLPVLSAVDAAL